MQILLKSHMEVRLDRTIASLSTFNPDNFTYICTRQHAVTVYMFSARYIGRI